MTNRNDIPISDASEPYDTATRSAQYSRSRWWRDQAVQRATRTILYELAGLEQEAARACDAAVRCADDPDTAEMIRARRDGHERCAREHAVRADQLVEMTVSPPPLTVTLPYTASDMATARDTIEALERLDANDRAVISAVASALRMSTLLLSERDRLRRQVEPFSRHHRP